MKQYERHEVIQKLKKRFPGNNPASWSKKSDKQLKEWAEEYLEEYKE